MIDFEGINSQALANAEGLLTNWLPDGKRRGREYVARNPKRSDNRAGSFSVNLQSGVWKDFASDDGGSDLISLRAFIDDCGQGEAAKAIAAETGMIESLRKRQARHLCQPAEQKAVGRLTAPLKVIPEPRAAPDIKHPGHGTPAFAWEYQNRKGQTVAYACRFENEGGKVVLPFSWTGSKWEWRAMPDPRPLYRLPEIVAKPDAVIVIAEGEKAADAVQTLFPDSVATTWAGGCKAWRKTAWNILKGRRVIIWPDADSPGFATGYDLHGHLLKLGADRVKIITPPEQLPTGWDAADAVSEGWSKADCLQLFAGFPGTPQTYCPLCWRERIAAPLNGPTCPHNGFTWPEWKPDHPDFKIDWN